MIDEEHETAFKQEDGVVYHARDMAVVRARLCAAPAILVSATPSLETLANVEAGRYRRLNLPSRHGGASLPDVALLDLDYLEDKDAAVDFNLVLTEDGQFVEVQGSGEEATFSEEEFHAMLALGKKGVTELITLQREAIAKTLAV